MSYPNLHHVGFKIISTGIMLFMLQFAEATYNTNKQINKNLVDIKQILQNHGKLP